MDLSERGTNAARHPWELARKTFVTSLARSALDSARGPVDVLDLGSGDSWLAAELLGTLAAGSAITCWDINYTCDDLAAPLPAGLTRCVGRPCGDFDVILMLDVLEHIEHDEEFLRDTVVPLLRPGGTLLFSVPAHPWLYSSHDEALGHVRRYRPPEAADILGRHLSVVRQGSLFTSLIPARIGSRALDVIRKWLPPRAAPTSAGVGDWHAGRAVTTTITAALTLDTRAGLLASRKGVRLPGLSYWAVCSKATS